MKENRNTLNCIANLFLTKLFRPIYHELNWHICLGNVHAHDTFPITLGSA